MKKILLIFLVLSLLASCTSQKYYRPVKTYDNCRKHGIVNHKPAY